MNKIKPFCVNLLEEDPYSDDIEKLFSECRAKGATIRETLDDWILAYERQSGYTYVGVDTSGNTLYSSRTEYFNDNVITLEEALSVLSNVDQDQELIATQGLMTEEVMEYIKEHDIKLESTVHKTEIQHVVCSRDHGRFKVQSIKDFRELMQGFSALKRFKE